MKERERERFKIKKREIYITTGVFIICTKKIFRLYNEEEVVVVVVKRIKLKISTKKWWWVVRDLHKYNRIREKENYFFLLN